MAPYGAKDIRSELWRLEGGLPDTPLAHVPNNLRSDGGRIAARVIASTR
jgi:hypothetical protein